MKTKTTNPRSVVARGGEICEKDERDQKVQTSSYKINHGEVMYSMVTLINTLLYI